MLLIGSRAIKYWFPDFNRTPKDWDLIVSGCPEDKLKRVEIDGQRVEMERSGSGNYLIEMYKGDTNNTVGTPVGTAKVVKIPELFLIKKSHIYWPNKWSKHINDYHYLKSRLNGPITDDLKRFYEMRLRESEERYGKRFKARLSTTNNNFFGASQNKVGRKYEHDDLHKVTCYYDSPLYDKMKNDKDKAAVDKKLWDVLSHKDKIRAVREECYAIGLERRLIPRFESDRDVRKVHESQAFHYALQRICTNLTSGWFRNFAIDNYPEIVDYDVPFYKMFIEAVGNGEIVKSIGGKIET